MAEELNRNSEPLDENSMMVYIDPKLMSSLNDLAEKKQEDLKALQEAAEDGDLEAMYRLGRSYYYGEDGAPKDGKQAFYWFNKAAEGDNIAAQYYLGLCYVRGIGVEKDEARAVELFAEGADQDYLPAVIEMRIYFELSSDIVMKKAKYSNVYAATADRVYD